MVKQQIQEMLKLYSPVLPDLKGDLNRLTLGNQLFLENCADRLTVLGADGSTRLKALEAVTMSLDGLTFRLTLKKGMYFHCGAEVTANDAVISLLQVIKNDRSASQLHRFVARDRQQGHGFAVYLISRYKFEISLTHRLQDLLARLALPEFSLRHEGRTCFSGLWKIAEQDPQGILLTVHERHVDAGDCQYQSVRWERLTEIPDVSAQSPAEPYLFIYPGSQFKTPSEELLTDEICRSLDGGLSFLFKIKASAEVTAELRIRLHHATRACFGKSAFWRRSPLQSLLPKEHTLHVAFSFDTHQPSPRRLQLRLVPSGEVIAKHMWEKLQKVAAEQLNLEIELVDSEVALEGYAGASAVIKTVFHAQSADYYTPLSQFGGELEDLYARDGHGQSAKPPRCVTDFCQHLTRLRPYAPFLAVPFVIRCNRNIKRRDSSGLLHFADVRQSSDRLQKQRMKEATLKALGAALQMFVHDVRRPFSMMQGILGLLESATSPVRLQEVAAKYLPDVKKSVSAVDRLVQDILEIGSDADPMCEDVDLPAAIDGVLRESFPLGAPKTLVFEYYLANEHLLHVDPRKLSRVLSNLVVNAAEAMNFDGTIWFEAVDDEAGESVQITVGNTNSFIPPELLGGLFDRFFTEGKKQGTGLGLAIVKKIVLDHGGQVWCQSDREDGTRFILTLPSTKRSLSSPLPASAKAAGLKPLSQKIALPRCGLDIQAAAGRFASLSLQSYAPSLASSGGLSLLLVDDNPVYLEIIQELLSREERDANGIQFHLASSAERAQEIVILSRIDAAIVDVDLGRDRVDGLELVRRLRSLNPQLKICVHSNGSPFDLQKKVIDAGGDLFLPKPMARDHLLRLLKSLSERVVETPLPRVAVVDDDALMLEMWEAQEGWEWHCFSSPAEFRAACKNDPGLAASLVSLITDFTFVGSSETGLDFAIEVANEWPDLPLFLATDRPVNRSALPACIRAVLPKDADLAMIQMRKALF